MQYAIRSFGEALDSIPLALAENSGLQPINTLTAVKSQQVKVLITNSFCGNIFLLHLLYIRILCNFIIDLFFAPDEWSQSSFEVRHVNSKFDVCLCCMLDFSV